MDTSSMNAGELSTKRSRSNSEQDNSDSIKISVKQRKVTIDVCDEIGIDVLLGYSNGFFGTLIPYSTNYDSLPHSIRAVDFNNDSQLDIIVANSDTDNLGIFLGYDNGSSMVQRIFSTGYQFTPYCVDVGDFNGDNRIDIVVVNYGSDTVGVLLGYGDDYSSNSLFILFGNSDGTFGNLTVWPTGLKSRLHSAVIGDLKNDQKLDLTVTNYGLDSIGVLIGNGDGSFGNFTTYSTGFESQSYLVALGDFNNDQFLDIVATNENADSIYIFLGYGNGRFQNAATYLNQLLSYPSWVAIGDFSDDSISDIIVSSS
ncbi:unnamed protein product [Rotaria magnacalcarata]|uniref:VCBS repeat-containing protein n=1 Tax=Rotaria magnacalcarata TaxID=392030 RepID=A0A816CJ51_9BILA|nr:unnamed protein product [Rotaria magnacalcarata]CAF1620979.1 unnamed protein product [Rotaria magnacalcarata]CAF2085618.1 unnamed protein product [Rotaria magnacalcarata]